MNKFLLLNVCAIINFGCVSASAQQPQVDNQRLVQLTRWNFVDILPASVPLPPPEKVPEIAIRIHASGFPTSPAKLANRVFFIFARPDLGTGIGKLPSPSFKTTEIKQGDVKVVYHTIEMWFEHWQLPGVLAMLGKIDRNEAVYCQFQMLTSYAQCHSNPLR